MEQNLRNNGSGASRLVSQLVAEKKKGIIVVCLIAAMGFMWVRVLSNKEPESAEAALTAQEAANGGAGSQSLPEIYFVELPNIKGRNDALSRDFFAAGNWRNFRGGKRGLPVDIEEDDDALGNSNDEVINRIVKKIRLEAIGLGENPQAFINDKLLSVGDKLPIRDGIDTYECEIIGIEKDRVLIRYEETEITLKLTQNERG